MEKTVKVTKSSDLYRKIDALGLPASERLQAIGALEIAEGLMNVVDRGLKLLGVVSSGVAAPNPKLKHQ